MTCTHCGLCLESCPTYALWAAEPDSPRGRIVLLEDALAPGGGATAALATHLDRCLGCMACMSVCPEEVPYAELLAAGRALVERDVPRPPAARRRRAAALVALPHAGRLGGLRRPVTPHHTPAAGPNRGRVALLLGCTQRARHADVHTATRHVLAAEGFEVIAPERPDCCGALELHAGQRDHALRRAQQTIDAFAAVGGVDHIVASTGGCGAALKRYGDLLGTPQARAFSSIVLDVHELLVRAPLRSPLAPLALRVGMHDACQLRHVQRAGDLPRELLSQIPAIELVDLPAEAGACCGAPGLYPLTQPAASAALGARQARAVLAVTPDLLVTADHSCLHQLQRHLSDLGRPIAVHHPIQVLARSMAAAQGG